MVGAGEGVALLPAVDGGPRLPSRCWSNGLSLLFFKKNFIQIFIEQLRNTKVIKTRDEAYAQ